MLAYNNVIINIVSLCSQDQYDNLAAHTHKGIDFLDKYGNFVKERCAIELEYAGKLRWINSV